MLPFFREVRKPSPIPGRSCYNIPVSSMITLSSSLTIYQLIQSGTTTKEGKIA
jgi:hypothetical protein